MVERSEEARAQARNEREIRGNAIARLFLDAVPVLVKTRVITAESTAYPMWNPQAYLFLTSQPDNASCILANPEASDQEQISLALGKINAGEFRRELRSSGLPFSVEWQGNVRTVSIPNTQEALTEFLKTELSRLSQNP